MKKKTPDERIIKLSYAKFEDEFGFKPKNKVEQIYFALKGKKPDQRVLIAMERLEAIKKAKGGE